MVLPLFGYWPNKNASYVWINRLGGANANQKMLSKYTEFRRKNEQEPFLAKTFPYLFFSDNTKSRKTTLCEYELFGQQSVFCTVEQSIRIHHFYVANKGFALKFETYSIDFSSLEAVHPPVEASPVRLCVCALLLLSFSRGVEYHTDAKASPLLHGNWIIPTLSPSHCVCVSVCVSIYASTSVQNVIND